MTDDRRFGTGEKRPLAPAPTWEQVLAKNTVERLKKEKAPVGIIDEIPELGALHYLDVSEEDIVRLQWYGLYHDKPKVGSFMMRIKVPGGLLRVQRPRRVRQEQHPALIDELQDVRASCGVQVHPAQGHRHHLRAGRFDGCPHDVVRAELPGPDDQSRGERPSSDDQRVLSGSLRKDLDHLPSPALPGSGSRVAGASSRPLSPVAPSSPVYLHYQFRLYEGGVLSPHARRPGERSADAALTRWALSGTTDGIPAKG